MNGISMNHREWDREYWIDSDEIDSSRNLYKLTRVWVCVDLYELLFNSMENTW